MFLKFPAYKTHPLALLLWIAIFVFITYIFGDGCVKKAPQNTSWHWEKRNKTIFCFRHYLFVVCSCGQISLLCWAMRKNEIQYSLNTNTWEWIKMNGMPEDNSNGEISNFISFVSVIFSHADTKEELIYRIDLRYSYFIDIFVSLFSWKQKKIKQTFKNI